MKDTDFLTRLAVIQRELFELKHNTVFSMKVQGHLNLAENSVCFAVYNIQKTNDMPIGVDKIQVR